MGSLVVTIPAFLTGGFVMVILTVLMDQTRSTVEMRGMVPNLACLRKEDFHVWIDHDASYRNMFVTRSSTVMMVVTRPRSVRSILIARPSRVLTNVFSLQRDPLASVGREIN